MENMKSFDEFLARLFPESRRKAYYLMSIHEHLPPQARKDLKEVGWTKGPELGKVARRYGQEFDCATWLHKARSLPKDRFKREGEKELTGRESEPWEEALTQSDFGCGAVIRPGRRQRRRPPTITDFPPSLSSWQK